MNQLLQEGRYRINHQFASNGQAAVYDAYDTVRNTNVLVKEVSIKINRVMTSTQQEQLKLAFANQAHALTEIKHDSLLHIHDFFSEIGRQYLVMEALDGEELSDLIATRDVRYSLDDMLVWADSILDGLNYLHKFSPPIIHKNIKPNHIKLTPEGKVKLLAFGLADGSDTKVSTNLTADLSKEEIAYSPLEQIWENLDPASQKVISNSYDERSEKSLLEPLDSRSDIYSFGATFYHLLTGRKPVDALERSIEMLDGKHDPLTPPHELKSSIPPEVSDVIMKAMDVKREDRFDSAAILKQILRTAMIRAREREDIEEVNEEREAAEAIRIAGETRNLRGVNPLEKENPFEARQPEVKVEEPTAHENVSSPNIHVSQDAIRAAMLEQKLREAEEQRNAAEQRAAEIERLLKEKESMASSPSIVIEDSLLDLGTASNPNIRPLNTTGKLPKVGTFAFERNSAKDTTSEFVEDDVKAAEPARTESVVEEAAKFTAAEPELPQVVSREPEIVAEPEVHHNETASFDAFEAERFISSTADAEQTEPQSFESQAENIADITYETAIDQAADSQGNAAFEADRSFYVERPFEVYQNDSNTDRSVNFGTETYASEHSEHESTRSSLPMPLIMGGAAVVFLIVVGGIYMMLSGGSAPATEVPKQMAEEVQSTQPAETAVTDPQPAAEPEPQAEVPPAVQTAATEEPAKPQPSFTERDQSISAGESRPVLTEQPIERRNAAPTPAPARQRRPAETTPTRQPAANRRQVTVDDLIRDN